MIENDTPTPIAIPVSGAPLVDLAGSIVSLADMRNAPVPEVVEVLEHLLDEARAGKIRGLVVAAGLEGRAFLTSITQGDAGIVTLLGSLRVVERDLLREVD